MIRIALIVIAFMGLTLSLILMQPSASGPGTDTAAHQGSEPQEVSRAAVAFDPAPLQPDRATPAQTPARPVATVDSTDALAQSLAVLRPVEATEDTVGEPSQETPRAAAATSPASGASPETLESLIISALHEGQNAEYIDALVNHAAEKGLVWVPGALLTADGRVDTATLLTVLSTSPDAMRAGARLYTVQPGDSLAAIAFRFYGTTERVDTIRTANAATLADDGGLGVGQELVIPRN